MRFAYDDAPPDLRDAIHEWIALHQINAYRTPRDAAIDYDPTHDEWRIEQTATRNGKPYIQDGEIAMVWIRRKRRAPLPARAAR